MSAKSELLAWVESRAKDADDVKDASRLIAAFVAESVRTDRTKQQVRRKFEDMAEMFGGLANTKWPRP